MVAVEWSDSAPIYRQLKDRVVAMMLDGVLKPGDALPSVRQVAAEYQLNPITVSRAYQELADEQLVEKRRGLGMYVTEGANARLLQSERERFLREEWPLVMERIHGIPISDIAALKARGVNFRDATLTGSNLGSGVFDNASFRDADLTAANLAGGTFAGADFRGASLSAANIGGVDLSRAKGLDQEQIDEACTDSATRLPAGLVLRGRGCHKGPRVRAPIPPAPPAPPPPPAAPRYLVAVEH